MCKNHNYCYIETPKENDKILKYNYGEKSINVSFVIYADLECLLEKIDTYQNHPQKSSTTKKKQAFSFCFFFFTHCSLDATKGKLECYRGKRLHEKLFGRLKRVCNKNNQL